MPRAVIRPGSGRQPLRSSLCQNVNSPARPRLPRGPSVLSFAHVRSRNLTIVFAGLCGYAERLGAQTWEESQRMLRLHEALVDPVLRKFKGRRIKQIAGTFLVAFESPTQAVLCAAALQHRAQRMELDVRIGIH